MAQDKDLAKGLNTIEKRKIEEVITGELDTVIENYQAKRRHDFEQLKRKVEETPSQKVKNALNAYNKAVREYEAKRDVLDKEYDKKKKALSEQKDKVVRKYKNLIEDEGYDMGYRYNDSQIDLSSLSLKSQTIYVKTYREPSYTEYKNPELTKFNNDTVNGIDRLKSLHRLFTLKVFTGEMKAEEVMQELSREIAKITT
jgi:ribosomal protein S17E